MHTGITSYICWMLSIWLFLSLISEWATMFWTSQLTMWYLACRKILLMILAMHRLARRHSYLRHLQPAMSGQIDRCKMHHQETHHDLTPVMTSLPLVNRRAVHLGLSMRMVMAANRFRSYVLQGARRWIRINSMPYSQGGRQA